MRVVAPLKKCPCCGSKAEYISPGLSLQVKVRCTRCGMSTVKFSSKDQAKKTWNRRVNDD
jgi:rRNA maturation protein Nop10